MIVQAVGMTNPGCHRTKNEDAIVLPGVVLVGTSVSPIEVVMSNAPAIFVAVDGLGGHGNGEIASRFVAHAVLDRGSQISSADELAAVLAQINQDLYRSMAIDTDIRGYGAVAAGIVVTDSDAIIFNLGDVRVYEFASDYAVLVSTDQRIPGSNIVTQSFGGADSFTAISPVCLVRPLDGPMRYLICTDGLWDLLDFELLQGLLSGESLNSIAENLMREALAADANDNVSLIVLDISRPEMKSS